MRACARWVGRVPDWPGRRAWAVAPCLRLSRRDLVLRESSASGLCLRVQRQGFAQALFCALAPSRAEPQISVALFLSCSRGEHCEHCVPHAGGAGPGLRRFGRSQSLGGSGEDVSVFRGAGRGEAKERSSVPFPWWFCAAANVRCRASRRAFLGFTVW